MVAVVMHFQLQKAFVIRKAGILCKSLYLRLKIRFQFSLLDTYRIYDILRGMESKNVTLHSYKEGLKDGVPIGLGYLSVSFAFGIFATGSGLKIWQALLISMTNLTSAGQLAGVPIIVQSLPFVEIALTQLIINLRYSLMSISLSQKADSTITRLDRFLISFFMTDEIFAVSSAKEGMVGRRYMYGLAVMPYIGWSLGTLLGAAAGNILPEPVTNALGIAIYGMFIAIIIPAAKKSRSVLGVVIVSCAMSVLFRFVPVLNKVSGGFVIIICAVAASALFAWLKPVKTTNSGASAGDGAQSGQNEVGAKPAAGANRSAGSEE